MDGKLKAEIISICCGKVQQWYFTPFTEIEFSLLRRGGMFALPSCFPVIITHCSSSLCPLTLCDDWDRAGRALLSYSDLHPPPPPKANIGAL